MAVPEAVRAKYAQDLGALESLHSYVAKTLRPWCESRDYPFHSRIKSEGSTSEKLDTGRYENWEDLDDLVAATIVVPTHRHTRAVVEKLDALFSHVATRGRGHARQAPDLFRFDSTRWYGTIPERDEIKLEARCFELTFEVQIQTAFENAWVRVTHDLVYKGQQVSWAQLRLAAQLKAAVEQIDLLIGRFEESAEEISVAPDATTDAVVSVIETSRGLLDDGSVDATLEPQSWRRFGQCVFQLARQQTRDCEEAKKLATEIVEGLAAEVRGNRFEVAMSGSMFQAIVAYTVQTRGPESLRRFRVVWSEELSELYGIAQPENALVL